MNMSVRRIALIVASVFLLLSTTACGGGASSSSRNTTGFVYEVVIPAGTFDQVMRGMLIDIIPNRLTVRVGDEFVIINNDVMTMMLETCHHLFNNGDDSINFGQEGFGEQGDAHMCVVLVANEHLLSILPEACYFSVIR